MCEDLGAPLIATCSGVVNEVLNECIATTSLAGDDIVFVFGNPNPCKGAVIGGTWTLDLPADDFADLSIALNTGGEVKVYANRPKGVYFQKVYWEVAA